MEKQLIDITRAEWIAFNWIDVTQMGDQGKVLISGRRRTPDERMQAMIDWGETEEIRKGVVTE